MLFDDNFYTIENPSTGIYKDRGSRFEGFAIPVKNETAVKLLLSKIKKEHPKANHHCYAFRLGPAKAIFRFSDDREPAGSAGKPIYGVIQSNDLTDILIVVVRYFGGTLLGVPGLINAYRTAAAEAIKNNIIISRLIMEKYRLTFNYDSMNLMMEMIKIAKAAILLNNTGEICNLEIELPRNAAEELILKIRNHYLLKEKCDIQVL